MSGNKIMMPIISGTKEVCVEFLAAMRLSDEEIEMYDWIPSDKNPNVGDLVKKVIKDE